MPTRRLLIGLALDAADPPSIIRQVQTAERIGLNLVLFDDAPGAPGVRSPSRGFDPIETASFASAVTQATGLVATSAATHAEPFHLSNRFSSLDWGSRGRAGWLVTVDASSARALAYSAAPPDAATARREAQEVVHAARRLWDSWEDGALIADTATGRFLDQEKLHYVDAGSEFFTIRGPALMPRPVQGQVVVLGRGDDGIAHTDVTLIQLADLTRASTGQRTLAELAIGAGTDFLAELHNLAGEVDGVVLHPESSDAALADLARSVAPALIDAGILVPPLPGQTLRGQLGLPRPASRYARSEGHA